MLKSFNVIPESLIQTNVNRKIANEYQVFKEIINFVKCTIFVINSGLNTFGFPQWDKSHF